VVALFHHPLNLRFIPHTAILPRNKARIAEGLSQFIQQNFLSSAAVVARVAAFRPAQTLCRGCSSARTEDPVGLHDAPRDLRARGRGGRARTRVSGRALAAAAQPTSPAPSRRSRRADPERAPPCASRQALADQHSIARIRRCRRGGEKARPRCCASSTRCSTSSSTARR
jgi:hypothetical protein